MVRKNGLGCLLLNVTKSQNTSPLVFKTGAQVMLVGVWFFLIGGTMTAGMVWLAFVQWTGPDEVNTPMWVRVALLVGAAFPLAGAALGVLLTFGGERITIDTGDRQVRVVYGRWWPWKRETHSLDEYDAVEMHVQSTRMGGETHGSGQPTHPVRLLAGGDELQLANVTSYRTARSIAEQVSSYTGLPLHDATEGEAVVREADSLSESLAERGNRLGEQVEWPKLRRNSRIEVYPHGHDTVIDLPRLSSQKFREGVIGVVFLLALYGGAMYGGVFFLRSGLQGFGIDATQGIWASLTWAVPMIPVAYILLFGVALLVARERIAISPRAFRRIWQFPIGSYTRKIPIGEIEELLSDGDDVIIRTDRATCRVGFTLDKKDRKWLREAIRYLLVHGPRR